MLISKYIVVGTLGSVYYIILLSTTMVSGGKTQKQSVAITKRSVFVGTLDTMTLDDYKALLLKEYAQTPVWWEKPPLDKVELIEVFK